MIGLSFLLVLLRSKAIQKDTDTTAYWRIIGYDEVFFLYLLNLKIWHNKSRVRITGNDMVKQNIYLVGPMGAGKTTIGKMLARELSIPFYDSDQEIEKRTGADIPWIFDVEGEEGFRLRERQIIADLCSQKSVVVATGGGAIGCPENRQQLRKSGMVIYLYAPVITQLERTIKDRKRPLLQSKNREQILTDLFQDRDPVYQDIADIVVDSQKLSPRGIIAEIMGAIDKECT
ncbi:Shikimate kinase 1 [invertebrate metagenome]|uniref:shikimate kinase n=1 Tax=invertebrate metagenome TaxID=1711999 RepID=A0A2H9T6S6_9ZZZZ